MDANIWFQDESAFGISLQSRFSWCQRCQRLHWYLSLQVFFNPTSCNANIFWIGETIEESTLMPDYILHLEQTLIPTGLLIYSPSVIKLMLLLLSWMKVPKLIQRRRHNFKLSWSSWEIHLWYLPFELLLLFSSRSTPPCPASSSASSPRPSPSSSSPSSSPAILSGESTVWARIWD